VHDSHVRLKNEFNIFLEIEKYDRLIESSGASMYDGWDELRPQVMELEDYLNTLGIDLKPCHNDALYENFIKAADGTIYLIDWEYSGMNDPMADFAALFIEAGFEPENEDYILEKYFNGDVPPTAKEKILCYQVLWDCLWAQWTVIKEAKGDDFGSYGIDRFNRAIGNIQKIKRK
ncbi:MAG: phosphotransferase, partial [Muribaculaceae bacterium]|nr:phosphotransferase [Muribaculaceae bacterium]